VSALKDWLDARAVEGIADRYAPSGLDRARFIREANDGLDALELKPRASHIAAALRASLPDDADAQVRAVEAACLLPRDTEGLSALVYFVDSAMLEHHAEAADFDLAMAACDALTRRFSAEFAVRPLLERDPGRGLAWLQAWAIDEDEHPRRLASEGTRPRLPWAGRLDLFLEGPEGDPGYAPITELLDQLREDESEYVRRSVANHVGDLAKIDLDLACELCERWLDEGGAHTEKLVRHALRHPVKKGEPRALAALGHGQRVDLEVRARFEPPRPALGTKVRAEVEVTNATRERARALVDLVVHFVKARGTSAKTFKLREVDLAPGESATLQRTVSLADLSTRKHYPGEHRVLVQVNGHPHEVGGFTLR
jgi:3-methyladenine DNA glycosylase AlkC